MKKENGQAARPKTSAKMGMMGTVHLELTPENFQKLVSGERTNIDLGHARELYLQVEQGPENRIVALTPWFDPDSTEVTVENSFQKDGEEDDNYFLAGGIQFTLVESEDSSLGFVVTPAQAKILARSLMNYVQAWEACDALKAGDPARA